MANCRIIKYIIIVQQQTFAFIMEKMQTFKTHIKTDLYLNGFQTSIHFPVFRIFTVSDEQVTMHHRSQKLGERMAIS